MSSGESVSEQNSPGPLFLLSSFLASSFLPSLPPITPSFLPSSPSSSLPPSLLLSFLPCLLVASNYSSSCKLSTWDSGSMWLASAYTMEWAGHCFIFVPGGERFSPPLLMSWEAFIPVWGLIGRLYSLQLLALGDRLLPGLVWAFHCRPSGESSQMCGLEHHQPERSSRWSFEWPQLYLLTLLSVLGCSSWVEFIRLPRPLECLTPSVGCQQGDSLRYHTWCLLVSGALYGDICTLMSQRPCVLGAPRIFPWCCQCLNFCLCSWIPCKPRVGQAL